MAQENAPPQNTLGTLDPPKDQISALNPQKPLGEEGAHNFPGYFETQGPPNTNQIAPKGQEGNLSHGKRKPGQRLPRVHEGPWRREYLFRSRYYERPGGLIHYIDEGKGPTLLMVHGNPTWSFMWRKLFLSFRENMRCIAPDHLGMGLSSRPMKGSYGFTLGERTSDLSAFIDSIIPDGKIHLVVHDWGGPIGLGWAAMHPERVSSITMMNTGLRVPLGFVLPPSLALFKKSSFLGWLLAEKFPFFTNGLARKGTLRPLTRDAKDGFLAPYTRAVFRKAISAFVEDIPLKGSHPSAPALQKVDSAFETLCCKPMSLIWGLRDFVFGPLFLQDFKKRAPHAKVLPLPRSGHYLLEDEPQKIVLALRHFLELCSSGSIKTR